MTKDFSIKTVKKHIAYMRNGFCASKIQCQKSQLYNLQYRIIRQQAFKPLKQERGGEERGAN